MKRILLILIAICNSAIAGQHFTNTVLDGLTLINGTTSALPGSVVHATVADALTVPITWGSLTGKPSFFSGVYSDLTGKPLLFSGTYADLVGKPSLATVATTGSYSSLFGLPTLLTIGTTSTTAAAGNDSRILAGASALQPTSSIANTTGQNATTTANLAAKADLVGGLILSSQLPSAIADILAYNTLSDFPATGSNHVVYFRTDTGAGYLWTGSSYYAIPSAPGSTNAVPEGATHLYFTNARVDTEVGVLAPSLAVGSAQMLDAGVSVINYDPDISMWSAGAPISAPDFLVNGNSASGLFDGSLGNVASAVYAGSAGSASTDSNGNTLSNLSDGTGGYTDISNLAYNVADSYGFRVPTTNFFDGTRGYVANSVAWDGSYDVYQSISFAQGSADSANAQLSFIGQYGVGYAVYAGSAGSAQMLDAGVSVINYDPDISMWSAGAPISAPDFLVNGNSASGLFDGSLGNVASAVYAGSAGSASTDSNGNTLSNLSDGTGGYTDISNLAYNVADSYGFRVPTTNFFDGTRGYVANSVAWDGSYDVYQSISFAQGSADSANAQLSFIGQYGVGYAAYAGSAASVDWSGVTSKPTLFSGNYSDLIGKPALFSGTYSDLAGLPVGRNAIFGGSYTMLASDTLVAITGQGGATLTLPAASSYTVGQPLYIKDEGGKANLHPIVIIGTIDGSTTNSISYPYGTMQLYSNGTAWFTLNKPQPDNSFINSLIF